MLFGCVSTDEVGASCVTNWVDTGINLSETTSDRLRTIENRVNNIEQHIDIKGETNMNITFPNVGFAVGKNPNAKEIKNFKLSGGFVKVDPTTGERKKFFIKEVIYRNPVVVTLWSDGTKTMSHCNPADTYSCESGLLICVMKKLYGSDKVVELLENWTPDLDVLDQVVSGKGFCTVNLRDVRKIEKDKNKK